MSLSADAIAVLAAKGLSIEDIVDVARANESKPADALEKRRQYDRERKRKARVSTGNPPDKADKTNAEVSADSTGNPPEIHRTPRARVGDNLLTTEGPCKPAAAAFAREGDDWPDGDNLHLAKQLASMAGPGLAELTKSPSLVTSTGEIHRWRMAGCSWALDVIPTVQGRTMSPRSRPIQSWGVLSPDVLMAREKRLTPVVLHPATARTPDRMSSWERQEADLRDASQRLKERYLDAV